MITDPNEMATKLKEILRGFAPPLQVRVDKPQSFEVAGTKPGMQGKQKVDGYYFASVVPKPKDVRLYFFPIYTHAEKFEDIPEPLRKFLKGKSCFHIKKIDEEIESFIHNMVERGIGLYQYDGLI
jgi:hypothetical protein